MQNQDFALLNFTIKEVLSGFSNKGMMTIGVLFVISQAPVGVPRKSRGGMVKYL